MPDVAELLGLLEKETTRFVQGCERAFLLTVQRLLSDLGTVDPKKFREVGCADSAEAQELILSHYGRILKHETTDLTELQSVLTLVFRPTTLSYALWVHVPQLTIRAAIAQQFLKRGHEKPAAFGAKEFVILNGMLNELRNAYDNYRKWLVDNDKINELAPIMENAHWGAIGARMEQLGNAVGAADDGTKKRTNDTTKIVKKGQ